MKSVDKVKYAMLAAQRTSKEQGLAAQALLELGDTELAVALAHEAVRRQSRDGRLAFFPKDTAITDPAAVGEAVLRAYEMTDEQELYNAADRMLEYYMINAPHTEDGIILYDMSGVIHADACFTLPPFLAVMDELIEAVKQLVGYMCFLRDEESGLLFSKYDAAKKEVVKNDLRSIDSGWALLGIARLTAEAKKQNALDTYEMLCETGNALLNSIIRHCRADGALGRFIADPSSSADYAAALTVAAFIYQGIAENRLNRRYLEYADRIRTSARSNIDAHGVMSDMDSPCETQAAFIMMEARRNKLRSG